MNHCWQKFLQDGQTVPTPSPAVVRIVRLQNRPGNLGGRFIHRAEHGDSVGRKHEAPEPPRFFLQE